MAEGAGVPLWSGDDRELFFVRSTELFAVPVSTAGGTPTFGRPHKVFDLPHDVVLTRDTAVGCAVAPDGRFLVACSTSDEGMDDHLIVALNWAARLPRLRR